jgi:Fic family protein
MGYIHQLPEWPSFHYQYTKISGLLERVNFLQGQLHGRMEGFSPDLRKQAIIHALTLETLASNAIEDSIFDYGEVESAIARCMKIRMPSMVASGGMAKGAAEALVSGISHHDKKLTIENLCQWHTQLYPGISANKMGAWRDTGLEIRDTAKQRIRFEAPAPKKLAEEMKKWVLWMNQDTQESSVIKAAIAQFWLLTLHPFADGNGPVSRVVSLMLMARSENGLPRYYAPSVQMLKDKDVYFQILENSQKGNLNLTDWIEWYLGIIEKSILEVKSTQAFVISRQKLEDKMSALGLSGRQKRILQKLSTLEKPNFTCQEWSEIAGYSADTALREIRMLLNQRMLQKLPKGGRSTRYKIVFQ